MEKAGFGARFIRPVLTLFIIMTLSWVIYKLAWRVENAFLHTYLSHVFGITFFISLGFGTLWVYRRAFFLGAGPGERILAALVNPFIFATKEVVALTSVYTVPEALYFYLNPIHVLLFSAAVSEIGLMEILCRRKLKKAGRPVRVWSIPAAAAFVLGLASALFPFAWGLGVHHFYIFQEGYKALFGYGVGL